MDNIEWLYDPKAKPAKELSKRDQRMIKLGWDAHKSFVPQPLDDKELREKIKQLNPIDNSNLTALRFIDFETGFKQAKCRILSMIDQVLALLQPKIEEAKRQEGERIDRDIFRELQYIWFQKGRGKYDNGWNDCRQWVFNHCFDKMRQALKGGE